MRQLNLPLNMREASVKRSGAPRRSVADTQPLLASPKAPYYLYRYIPLSYGSATIFAIFGRS